MSDKGAMRAAAVRTLKIHGFTYHGGVVWCPPDDAKAEMQDKVVALVDLTRLMDERDAIEAQPHLFGSGKEYRHAVIEAIEKARQAREKCRALGLEV